MKATMTVGDAVAQLWQVAKAKRIAGEAPGTNRDLNIGAVPDQNGGGGFTLNWDRVWGASATLAVRTTAKGESVVLGVEVRWPSTNHSPMSACCDAFPPLKP